MLRDGGNSANDLQESGFCDGLRGVRSGWGRMILVREEAAEWTLGEERVVVDSEEKDQMDFTWQRWDRVEVFIIISMTGVDGSGVSGCLVCIVVDGDIGL
jgi:hypothetical protein